MEAISTGGQTGSHTLHVITEGVDKPNFQMIRIAGYITTNGVHVDCKELEQIIFSELEMNISMYILF